MRRDTHKNVRSIGGCDHSDTREFLDTVHFVQQTGEDPRVSTIVGPG
jgi:hypothetical protein